MLWILLMLCAPCASAFEVRDAQTGCSFAVPGQQSGERFAWHGACVNDRAEGEGALTSSHGAHWRGQMRAGHIVRGTGLWLLAFAQGRPMLANLSIQPDQPPMFGSFTLPPSVGSFTPIDIAPLAGRWALRSQDGACEESHVVSDQGHTRVHSGAERVHKASALLALPGQGENHVLLSLHLAGNGEPDCQGQRSAARPGELRFSRLRRDGPDAWWVCSASDAQQCGARLTRLPAEAASAASAP